MAAAVALVRGDTGSRIDDEVQQAARAMGLAIEDGDAQQSGGLAVWPENEITVRTFVAMGTQWNVGFSGAIGLRYEALPVVFDVLGIAADERAAVFAGLRTMEHAALGELNRGG